MDGISSLDNDDMVEGMNFVKEGSENYIMGKNIVHLLQRATEPFKIVHNHACGPMHVNLYENSRCLLTFIDFFQIYLIVFHQKQERANFEEYLNYANNLLSTKVQNSVQKTLICTWTKGLNYSII